MSTSPREPAAPVSEERLRQMIEHDVGPDWTSVCRELLALRAGKPSPPEAQACVVPGHAEAVRLADLEMRYCGGGPMVTHIEWTVARDMYRAARRPSEAVEARYWCTCSADPVKIDEDACCASCGATAWTTLEVQRIAARASASSGGQR